MFVERRKISTGVKFYLIHSYRDEKGTVKKIRKYLGKNLNEQQIVVERKKAEKIIEKELQDINERVFNSVLTKNQIKKINSFESKMKIIPLDSKDWKKFAKSFVYNTNAIEGSTIALSEISEILSKKKLINLEEIETKNVYEAIEFVKKTRQDLSLSLVKELHMICFKNSKSFAGNFRTVEVVIKNTEGKVVHRGVPVKGLNKALKEYIIWYEENKDLFKPLALAALMHNQFEHIHPFRDGNGRVGRLILNLILLKNKFPPINILLEDREKYYLTLQEYSTKNNLIPTIKFLINQYKKTLK